MKKRMMKRIIAVLSAAMMLITMFSACTKPETDAPEEIEEPDYECSVNCGEHTYGDWEVCDFGLDILLRECSACGKHDYMSGWVAPEEVTACTLSEDTLRLAEEMPHASYDDLPYWNGVSIHTLSALGTPARMSGFTTNPATVQKMVDYGFNYSRVTLDMQCFFRDETMQEANTKAFLELDNIITTCVENGIHCSLNSHFDFGRDEFNWELDTTFKDPAMQDGFVHFWEFLAERYKDVSSNALDFDLMNEPRAYDDEQQYIDLMVRTIDAVREISPDRLIVVEMSGWSTTPVPELAEKQIVEAFHYYIPNTDENRETEWTPNSVYRRIKEFVDFGNKNGIKVILNECGASFVSPAEETAAWFDALFDACNKLGVSWNMHDVSGYFGFATYDKWCIREDTPHAILTDEGFINYIYPEIYESFEKNIDPERVNLSADSLRELYDCDPERFVFYLTPSLYAENFSSVRGEEGCDWDRCKGCFGGNYVVGWHCPQVSDSQKYNQFVLTPTVMDYEYNFTYSVPSLTGKILDAIIVTEDGTIYEIPELLGEFNIDNGEAISVKLSEEISGLSSDVLKNSDIMLYVSVNEPDIY